MSDPIDYSSALDDLAPADALDVVVGSAVEEMLTPAAIVRPFPWQCDTCSHHEMWHLPAPGTGPGGPAGGACTRADCEPRCTAWVRSPVVWAPEGRP